MTESEVRTLLLYGDSGSGKSTQLAMIALWIWEKYHKRSKLISCDPAGTAQFDDMGLIESGIVDRFNLMESNVPIADLSRIAKGYWPKPIKNDETGADYTLRESREFKITPEDNIGAILNDSIVGTCTKLAIHLSRTDKKMGFVLGGLIDEDGFKFGNLDKGHYGTLGKLLTTIYATGFRDIPIDWFIATTTVDKAEEMNKCSGYYPESIGRQHKTALPRWFSYGNLYLSDERVLGKTLISQKIYSPGEVEEDKTFDVKVAWIKDHNDQSTDIPYKAKLRVPPQGVRYMEQRYREGYCVLDIDRGVSRLLEYTELVKTKVKKETKERLENAKETNSSNNPS